MKPTFFSRHKEIALYGIGMAGMLLAFQWLEINFYLFDITAEFFIGGIALIFTLLGIWLALKLSKPKTIVVEKTIYPAEKPAVDPAEIQRLGISKRELEVLQLIAKGHSNNEIASELFVSLNTVKTHAAKLFEKLEVNRRTQAIEKAKQIGLLR